jgi:putative heme-binding domain-containing protein
MKKPLILLAVAFLAALPLALAQTSSPGWGSARWVWDQADGNQASQTDDPRYLRRTFELSGKQAKAELWITADNEYTVYVNGQKVGAGTEWSKIDHYDVAKYLAMGKNVLAIRAQNHGGPAGVIARLHVVTADKKELIVGTDDKTHITQIANADWLKRDFDDTAWPTAAVLGDVSIGPWNIGGSAPSAGGQKSFQFQVADPKIKERQKAEDQLKNFIVPDGFEVELVAADPLVINPVTMAVDEQGRIYVSESHTYRYGPSGSPIKPYANPLVRLDPVKPGEPGASATGVRYNRVLIADGFEDPVMGIAVKGNKLWVTANNYLYTYDIPPTPQGEASSPGGKQKPLATNKKTLITDKHKAWNPFGMFVLEFGPDGMLYMSVGNHGMELQGPGGVKITTRGGSGTIVRMNPDGTKMEKLVQGLRVPYSFEMDPFGQLWLLSNGEGNPDRFVRVIEGVDYHCYSRPGVDNAWLAGNHPLAPPCFELHRGAHTQLMRYYAAAFPQSYQGSLLACNWGSHGFPGLNRGIFRYVPDERNNITKKEPFVMCSDPYFRPSHIFLDPDGNLLIADWYGRDDESDLTGRIWRVKYTGKEPKPAMDGSIDTSSPRLANVVRNLGSPNHRTRAAALQELAGNKDAIAVLREHVATAKEPLGAAYALWALARIGTLEAKAAMGDGIKHRDWKVRRLTLSTARRYNSPDGEGLDAVLAAITKRDRKEAPEVWVELVPLIADLYRNPQNSEPTALSVITETAAAADPHLRYEAAWHFARLAQPESFTKLLGAEDENVRLAGLIAIDIACYENLPTKKAALAALGKALNTPGKLDLTLALQVAQLNGDASLAPALEKLVARQDVPLGVIAKGLLVLKSKTGSYGKAVEAGAAKRFVEAVEKGAIKVTTPSDQVLLFEFLEMEGPTDFALKQIAGQVNSGQPQTRSAALLLARKFGPKSAPVAASLWPGVLNPKTKAEDAADYLATLAAIESPPNAEKWQQLVTGKNPLLRTDAVRWWRSFKDRPEMVEFLQRQTPALLKEDAGLREDLGVVFRHLGVKTTWLELPAEDKTALTTATLDALAKMPAAEKAGRTVLGKQVFERTGCTKCHTTATQTTLLAPSLKGIGAQKLDYLVESVLYPSKVIKTGFETESIVTKDGRTLSGLVKEEGGMLRVLNLDKDVRIAKADVEERRLQKISIMPEGQEALMSRREFIDLVTYLGTLK